MKVVIFAGGVGTRLWPLSRKNTPKQFEKIIGDKSTLQLMNDRVEPIVKPEDIYISSGKKYQNIICKQLPKLPKSNVILEPEMRDVGPAVGLVTAILAKVAPDEPFIILWSDHLVKNEDKFRNVLQAVESILRKDKEKIVFIGQKSRFPSQNLGWIESGKETNTVDKIPVYEFKSFHYRPNKETAEKYHNSHNHSWNPGYFGTTAGFLFSLYKKFQPEIHKKLKKIQDAWGTKDFEKVLSKTYPTFPKESFDDLIIENLSPKDGCVLSADLGWSDIGAWEALKEALSQESEENVFKGDALAKDTKDTLIFNYTNQLVVGIDLEGFIIVNTEDVIMICPKDSVPKVKKVVKSLAGTKHESLT